jgi:hypothetical protein
MVVSGNRLAGVTSDGGFVVWELPKIIEDDVPLVVKIVNFFLELKVLRLLVLSSLCASLLPMDTSSASNLSSGIRSNRTRSPLQAKPVSI